MLETERKDGVFRITLNRPEKRNALSLELCRKLISAFEEAERDDGTRAILLTAQGATFCAGMDLSEIGDVAETELSALHHDVFTVKDRSTKPIVTAINGDVLGGGVGLVANTHIAVVCPRVEFGLTEIKLGLWPFLIFNSVARAVGERLATEWSLTGRMLDSDEARAIGLVQYVSKNALEKATGMAQCLANSSRTAIRTGLAYIQQSAGRSKAETGDLARKARVEVMTSREFAEGLKAFREKRSKPREC
jgi:enoyl-CoA hydratase/carnithine racemase